MYIYYLNIMFFFFNRSLLFSDVFIKVEIMVPGPKVGLIIGKGGETIKQLQEKSGAKMVVIQDGPSQENEKPLRITGEPQKVEVNFLFSVDIALKCKCAFLLF